MQWSVWVSRGRRELNREPVVPSTLLRVLAAVLGSSVVLWTVPWISHRPAGFYHRQTGWVVLDWEYVSTPVESGESGARLSHMRLHSGQLVRRRAPVEVRLLCGGDTVLRQVVKPRGIRGDGAIVVYAEVPVRGQCQVEFHEQVLPERVHRSEPFEVRGGEVVLVKWSEGHFRLVPR